MYVVYILGSLYLDSLLASLVAQMVKNQPAMKETQVHSLGQENPPQKGITINSSSFAWEIPWTEEAWHAAVHGVAKSQTRLSD